MVFKEPPQIETVRIRPGALSKKHLQQGMFFLMRFLAKEPTTEEVSIQPAGGKKYVESQSLLHYNRT